MSSEVGGTSGVFHGSDGYFALCCSLEISDFVQSRYVTGQSTHTQEKQTLEAETEILEEILFDTQNLFWI